MMYDTNPKCIRNLIRIVILLVGTSLLALSPIYAQQTIKFGLHQNKPLNFQDTDSQVKGLVIDVFTHIADKENWKIEYVPCAWGDCLDKLKNGDIDVLSAIGYTQKRHNIYDFTSNPLITNWGVVVTQPGTTIQSILDLDGKTIGVMKRAGHTVAFQKLLGDFNINAKYLVVDDFLSVFRLVHEKKIDAGIVNRLITSQYINEYNVLKSSIIFNPIEIRYAFTKNRHTEMLLSVDRHLSKLRESPNSIYFQAIDRWFNDNKTGSIPSWLIWLICLGIISLLLTSLWSFSLKKQVARRTSRLEEEIKVRKKAEIELQRAHDELDYRVRERTSELTKTNKQLGIEINGRKQIEEKREKLIKELHDALEEVKTLQGILPICSQCKKIRDDKGYWNQIEGYIQKHSEAEFSHGMCPECSDDLYGDEDWYIEMNKKKEK